MKQNHNRGKQQCNGNLRFLSQTLQWGREQLPLLFRSTQHEQEFKDRESSRWTGITAAGQVGSLKLYLGFCDNFSIRYWYSAVHTEYSVTFDAHWSRFLSSTEQNICTHMNNRTFWIFIYSFIIRRSEEGSEHNNSLCVMFPFLGFFTLWVPMRVSRKRLDHQKKGLIIYKVECRRWLETAQGFKVLGPVSGNVSGLRRWAKKLRGHHQVLASHHPTLPMRLLGVEVGTHPHIPPSHLENTCQTFQRNLSLDIFSLFSLKGYPKLWLLVVFAV